MKMLKKIALAVALTPLIALVAPIFIIICLPIIIFCDGKAAINLFRFRFRESGHYYLICTSHRGWHDFIKNNLIPILPKNTRVVWHKSTARIPDHAIFCHLRQSKHFGISKPYLVAVEKKGLKVLTLNTRLQHLKLTAKASDQARAACATIIQQAIMELRT